ncbi:aldehyde dehydrogenase (NAD+) [Luteibacter sp. OK325]|uniref:aldehyde dehydrogenase n=1 Tax=Luteibacter sp. OK325 TaxID=2135670 RepID=UPI000D3B2327|nr:aldehyde dehydrogenase [Luteibacter sp. OK325]PTR34116.1 aldehyde dehydrogenase (NAD+) [Luteibacter sp. OK325]
MTNKALTAGLEFFPMLIGGRRVDAIGGKTTLSINPYNQQPWAVVPEAEANDAELAVEAAREAFDNGPWGRTTAFQRAALMRRLADLIERDAEKYARIETMDNGKLYKEMLVQWRYMPEWFRYFAGLAVSNDGQLLQNDRTNFMVYTRREPVGVVAAITPWNSPIMLMIWKLAPALAAGCTFVVKPSEYTPVSTLAFADLMQEAGFPAGVFNVVTGGPAVGAALTNSKQVDKVVFTGSTQVGIAIGKAAMANLTRISLELGGKSANIIFEDSDLNAAVNGAISGIFAATGQTCMAGSRLLVHRSVHDEVVRRISERAKTIKLGDPLDPETEMGPVVNQVQFDRITAAVRQAAEDGATVAAGGGADQVKGGLFIAPTILTGVTNRMTIATEELFGPVLVVIPFDSEEDAIALANDSDFGLACGIWTTNVQRAHRVAAKVRAGTVWINAYRIVAPNAPFGGFKQSGIGRENGVDGLREYTESKSVWVELSGVAPDPFTLN